MNDSFVLSPRALFPLRPSQASESSSMTSRLSAQELASLRQAAHVSTADAQDLVQLASSSSRPELPPDEALAIQLWQQELQTFSRGLRDQQLARDLERAQQTGVSLDTIRRHRERSEQVATSSSPVQRPACQVLASTSTSASSPRLSRVGLSRNTHIPTATHSPSVPPGEQRCVICLGSNDLLGSLTMCGHYICRECLDQAFLHAAKDESLFPPKGCQQAILTNWALPLVSAQTARAFGDAEKECTTEYRVHCYKSDCSTFLGGDFGTKVDLTCSECGRQTCSACKGPKVSLRCVASGFCRTKAAHSRAATPFSISKRRPALPTRATMPQPNSPSKFVAYGCKS